MTPLPKRRWSTRRQGKKRASQKAFSLKMVKCEHCGQLKPSHHICSACGYYRGKPVISIKTAQK
ncbi:MAG TPA: 50S ribosomal protein L32 [Clostridia bacterium]|nr:50S ribosomal protein L32 [Clostridia bacterium]